MKKRYLIPLAVMGCCLIAQAQAPRPNIVYFFADDLGWSGIKANQQLAAAEGVDMTEISKIITPNIDSLVAGGINFTHAYGSTVCSPSRSSQQTGFHQGHTWADRNDKADDKAMRAQDPTIGKLLNEAGYRNGMYGKWGYGGSLDPTNAVIVNQQTLPIEHGYHDCVVELHHVRAHTFLQPSLWYSHVDSNGTITLDTTLRPHSQTYPDLDVYADNFYAAGAIDFIRDEANGPSPFFVQLSFQVPHSPYPEIETLPDWFDDYAGVVTHGWTDKAKQYAAMITLMDKRIGDVLAALRDPNNDGDQSDSVMANTLIIFASDNGTTSGAPHDVFNETGHLRSFKGYTHEGGIRDPLAFFWEGVIAPGQSTDYKTGITDIFPTFCELAGVDSPVGLDGVSIAPLLTGNGPQRKRPYFCYEPQKRKEFLWSVVRDDMKLTRAADGTLYLYDIAADEAELNDLATNSAYASVRDELLAIAMGDKLEEVDQYANVFPTWVGGNGADVNSANSWQEAGYWPFPNKWVQTATPTESWIAVVRNTNITDQTAFLNDSIQTLGFGVAGNPTAEAMMELTLSSNLTLVGRNEIRLAPFSALKLTGSTLESMRWVDVYEDATLYGPGTIDADLYNQGTVEVISVSNLAMVASLSITGNFHQANSALLNIEPGAYTSLVVSGYATLSGRLECPLPAGFSATIGDRFTALTASSVIGTFANADGMIECGGHHFRIHYATNNVELEKVAVTAKGTPPRVDFAQILRQKLKTWVGARQ